MAINIRDYDEMREYGISKSQWDKLEKWTSKKPDTKVFIRDSSKEAKEYINHDIEITKEVSDRMSTRNNFYVNFAGKTYKPDIAEIAQTAGEYPIAKLECEISPRNCTVDYTKMLAKNALNSVYGIPNTSRFFEIKNVIFNPPATIVFWTDGTKTVVKAHDERFDPEKGLAMAIAKKAMGNKGNYFNQIKKWTDQYIEKTDVKMTIAEPVTFELHNVKFNDEEFGKMIGEVNPRKKLFHFEFKPNKDDK